MIDYSEGILWYIVFLFSTTLHEASHAFTAMKMGDLTAYESGQVSLSPIPHVKREPLGTVVIPVISFLIGGWMIGWASAPYDPEWAYKHPKKSAAMAAAGPISNFILVILSALLIHIGIYFGIFYAPETITTGSVVEAVNPGFFESAAKILSIMFSLNLILLFFNLIPVPPLDGSGIIPMFLSEETGRKYMKVVSNSAFALIGILIAWKLFDLVYFNIHTVFINLLYPGSNYQ
jgi:Zn-dependent protease